MEHKPPLSFAVVILAAGKSRRMGQTKLLLSWGEGSVLAHLVRQWTACHAAQSALVSGPDAKDLHDELDRLRFAEADRIENPAPDRGMFSSIQCAAAWPHWKSTISHWIIALGDQPHLRPQTLEALIQFGAENPSRICQPLRHGRYRHPVLLPQPVFLQLKDSALPDFKAFLEAHATQRSGFECDDDGLDLDMDTPADYKRLRELYRSRAAS